MFWIMVVIALSFVIIAVTMVTMAKGVSRAVKSVDRLEQNWSPDREGDGYQRAGPGSGGSGQTGR